MSEDTFTNANVAMDNNKTTNDINTSIGVDIVDDINYNLPTDDFNIVGVLDDAVLGEIYTPNVNDLGEVISKGGIVLSTSESIHNDNSLYKVMKVNMVGKNVDEITTGDYVVVSDTAGMKMVEFNGLSCAMVRERQIFLKVEPK